MRNTSLFLLVCTILSCGLPKDSDHTLDRVRHGTIRTGYILHSPWVSDSTGEMRGVDVQLVNELARGLEAKVAWVRGTESELMSALHGRQLDLVVGGLSGESPWKHDVAFTRPYYTDSLFVALPPGVSEKNLKGTSVAYEAGTPAGVYLHKKGAVPVPVHNLQSTKGAVAAPTWRLESLGRPASEVLLHKSRRVMAVAPGENAWLLGVERVLHEQETAIPAMLRALP
jgi:polar amino acid transport system substrate-binding protein